MADTINTGKQGFKSMPAKKVKEIASMGGHASHGTAKKASTRSTGTSKKATS